MSEAADTIWKQRVVSPLKVLDHIKPGMNIFSGSGVAEPRTLMKYLLDSNVSDVKDLELIQLNSHGDILSLQKLG